MKINGNDQRTGDYYLGLDVGTNSVGWAVTDREYKLLKHHGNAMWGARLFDEATDAASRRTSRVARRRLARRNQRLRLLEVLFEEEIRKVDPLFYQRLNDSALWLDDKTDRSCRFSLFNDPSFTDREYHRRYPTVYHLREELMRSDEPHDVRLVFLAIHHIMKSRGHFLYDSVSEGDSIPTPGDELKSLAEHLSAEYGLTYEPQDPAAFEEALCRADIGIRAKQKLLREAWGGSDVEDDPVWLSVLTDMLAGAKIDPARLYNDRSLDGNEVGGISLNSDLDARFDELSALLGDRVELILRMKDVYDAAVLSRMLKGHGTLSAAKVALYEKNRADLRILKRFVRAYAPDKYKEIFSLKKEKLNNYAAYSGYLNRSGAHSCTQEEFCKYLVKALEHTEPADPETERIFREIGAGTFLTRLRGHENGVIPYQLQRMELRAILTHAAGYLPFLDRKDEDGNSVRDKILKTFEFRIPYYVGPLNSRAGNAWAVRFPGKEHTPVTPWNFESVIDTEASSAGFILKLIGRCTYTGDYVLPRDSLLYSEFMLLNELNPLQIDGKPLDTPTKQALVRDLFEASRRPVTKKAIRNYLICQGHMSEQDEITGIDDRIKTTLRSFHDFRRILEKTGDREMVEEIIRRILIFGNDRAMLKKWLKASTHGLNDEDIAYICRLKYTDWGRLSRVFLTEIHGVDRQAQTGEAYSVIEMLRETNLNLMQILSDRFTFRESAEAYRQEHFGCAGSLTERLEELYIAPAVRRSIRQTLRIVDEIVDIRKAVPEKIFIEMARDSSKELRGKRTESRKDKLLALYRACREQSAELLPRLEQEDDNSLRSDRLYLYYTQFGRCMYSGEPIDLEELMTGRGFDIDHIFPRSRIKDNSLENRVVVKNTLNREKSNTYPLDSEIRQRMRPYWDMLLASGMISRKKYDRLIRPTQLTDEELASFVARQLVETQQSTKALTILLQERYGDRTRVVFSKAGNVSDFRQTYDLLKCREVNDLHHAKDAYLNIVVGNVYCTRFTDAFFRNIRNETYSLNRVFEFDVPRAWDKDETIKTVKKMMAKNNPIVTRMPWEAKGALYKLQPVPRGKGQLPKKTGMDKDRYGGYTEVRSTYYTLVEHTLKKKRVRTIEPVYLYCKERYEKDPLAYCRDVLDLEDPCIVCREIRFNSLLEVDGSRLYIRGRSNSMIKCQHAYQLAIDPVREKMIRDISKYVERCKARRTELPVTPYDHISTEANEDLYGFFLKKLQAPVYHALLGSLESDIEKSRDIFATKSLLEQCQILLEILKAFLVTVDRLSLKELCGKGEAGQITINKKITGKSSVYLIHQSPTGLYEVREDLLK